MTTASFDAVHVVSDLHLGGASGFQIMRQSPLLAATIDRLRETRGDRRIALVLNGDIVDFLAEPEPKYFDADGAVDKLQRIIDDAAFADVFTALAKFVATDDCHLVLVLGNHDVELALPRTRRYLVERLCRGNAAAQGRLIWAVDGAGFACEVGGKRVLCVHGNEADTWNLVDYRNLLEVARAQNRRTDSPEWTPNGGTKLVIDVMNHIKQEYRWVDLLKPETSAVPAVLIALGEVTKSRVWGFVQAATRTIHDHVRHAFGLLSDGDAGTPENQAAFASSAGSISPISSHDEEGIQELFELIERHYRPSDDEALWLDADGLLGDEPNLWQRLFRRLSPEEILRRALLRLKKGDRSFVASAPDPKFEPFDRSVSEHVDFLVAGHTHFRKRYRRTIGSGLVLNSGTWIDLISLEGGWLDNPEIFRTDYLEALKKTRKDSLPALEKKGLILKQPTVVSIAAGIDEVEGHLFEARPDGSLTRVLPEDEAGR